MMGTRMVRMTRIFHGFFALNVSELSIYWNGGHYVRETFKVSRTFEPFLDKKYTRAN